MFYHSFVTRSLERCLRLHSCVFVSFVCACCVANIFCYQTNPRTWQVDQWKLTEFGSFHCQHAFNCNVVARSVFFWSFLSFSSTHTSRPANPKTLIAFRSSTHEERLVMLSITRYTCSFLLTYTHIHIYTPHSGVRVLLTNPPHMYTDSDIDIHPLKHTLRRT